MGHNSNAAQALNPIHPGFSFPNVAAFLPFCKAERNKELPEWLIKGQLRQHCAVSLSCQGRWQCWLPGVDFAECCSRSLELFKGNSTKVPAQNCSIIDGRMS